MLAQNRLPSSGGVCLRLRSLVCIWEIVINIRVRVLRGFLQHIHFIVKYIMAKVKWLSWILAMAILKMASSLQCTNNPSDNEARFKSNHLFLKRLDGMSSRRIKLRPVFGRSQVAFTWEGDQSGILATWHAQVSIPDTLAAAPSNTR